jgi:hypothetical protein
LVPLAADLVPVEPLRAPLARLDPEPADLAPVEDDLVEPLDLRAPDDFAFEADDRDPEVLREPLPRDEEEEVEPPELALPSTVHLPDITRCAASATASAISEPSLVALCITLLAA